MTITLDGTTGISTPPVSVLGNTSGSITFAAPDVAGSNTQTLVAATGTLAPLILGTAVASTSGTSIDFTGIPSWVKRITVMLNGVSTNGSSNVQIQIGAGSITTTGYLCYSAYAGSTNASAGTGFTTGFGINLGTAANLYSGHFVFTNISGNAWVGSFVVGDNSSGIYYVATGGGSITLGGALDRVRITTVNGTDAFDAGNVNILYEQSMDVFNIAITLAGFLGGWILNNMHKSLDRLDTDVRAMPHNYVTRAEYRDDMRDIKDMLGKIFDRLEAKQDK